MFPNRNNLMLAVFGLLIPLFFFFLLIVDAQAQQAYYPTERILLNCGEQNNLTSRDSLEWMGDAKSGFCMCDSQTSSSSMSKASQQALSGDPVLYNRARIIHSNFTYTFPVVPGPKFIRLHFYPTTYSNLDMSKSFFTVTANNFTLVSNFSAYLAVSAMKRDVFFKEFIVPVWGYQDRLDITFSPSQGSYAFINGVEIVSMPTNLYTTETEKILINDGHLFSLDNKTALETLYRIKVGGQYIQNTNDTGMLRRWDQDLNYILGDTGMDHEWYNFSIQYTNETPAYVAPAAVYQTRRSMGRDPNNNLMYNLTWIFPNIDPGFDYLLRFHFCEVNQDVTPIKMIEFSIFINNMVAEPYANVLSWAHNNYNVSVKRDYIVSVPSLAGQRKLTNVRLELHPNSRQDIVYADAFLNGLEIIKLSDSSGSLAGFNPELDTKILPGSKQTPLPTESRKSTHIVAVVGVVLGVAFALALFLITCFIFHRRRKTRHAKLLSPFCYTLKSSSTNPSSLPTDLCRRFAVTEIREATRNFDDENFIGAGGFGNVYKGYIENGNRLVAIKRLAQSSVQGTEEFHTEIKMLSNLRHVHLVSLIGFCNDQGEMILVYEYMERGTLRDHLYKKGNPPLPWKQRLEICIGAAKGLHYLHSGVTNTIIHRDVKSANILLDENWIAKVSDFGLSKIGPTGISQTHVSTIVKGSFGYLDPEYYRRQQLTEKSDVYSFGVVLLEVLCARPPVISSLPKDEVSLVEWVRSCYRKGIIDQIIDPHLKEDIKTVCINKFVEIAFGCLHDRGTERPAMGDIIWSLEFCLQLQESLENLGDIEIDSNRKIQSAIQEKVINVDDVDADDDDKLFTSSSERALLGSTTGTFSADTRSDTPTSPDRINSQTVFSEIMNPTGR